MKVYDCFLFNTEMAILKLRLEFLWDEVDYFVIVESSRTLSNQSKPLSYQENSLSFEKYKSKIIHIIAESNDLPAWEYEYFQRNSIKNGLDDCEDTDIVFISDVDEIINIKEVLKRVDRDLPTRIEIPMYYYYLNLRTDIPWIFNIVAPASFIKKTNIGNRTSYETSVPALLTNAENKNGWHFSYLFGRELALYVAKVRSFSHQEFNTPYFLNERRIAACINYGIDLFERAIALKTDNIPSIILKEHISNLGLQKYVFRQNKLFEPGLTSVLWLFRIKVINRIRNAVRNRL